MNLEIDDNNNDNYININYLDKNNEDIGSNLGKIDENKEDIASNLSEKTYIKNNAKSYLKNVHNILFYADKEQVNFRNNFYNKTFEVNANKNDLIEINLKMLLEYEYINKAHIVIVAFKLINDNKEEIYVNTYHNGDDILYKNFVF